MGLILLALAMVWATLAPPADRVAAVEASGQAASKGSGQSGRGTIKGHVRLMGKLPGNPIIRMGVDPMCNKLNAGKRVVQETVVASVDGSLANVFVRLQGTFPPTAVPTEPVIIDQRACIYLPRVVGARVGQTLQVQNSDAFFHNVHSVTTKSNAFNVGQAVSGIISKFVMKDEEVMLGLKCDVHRWMTAYVGVVPHPYFAVSNASGAFEINSVPPGAHTIQIWHEAYGPLTQVVRVRAGATTDVELSYTGTEKPRAEGVRQLVVGS